MQCLLEPATRQWIDDLIRQHDERIARRATGYVRRVTGWMYDEVGRTVVCRVAGSGDEPYRVALRLPVVDSIDFEHPPDGLDAVCTCPYSEGGRFLCKHTFAAATRLAELWDAHPTAKIDRLLRDRAMPSEQALTRGSRNLRIDRRQTQSGPRRPRRPQGS